MKLTRFNGGRIGLVVGDSVQDIADLIEADLSWPPCRVEAGGDQEGGVSRPPESALAFTLQEAKLDNHIRHDGLGSRGGATRSQRVGWFTRPEKSINRKSKGILSCRAGH